MVFVGVAITFVILDFFKFFRDLQRHTAPERITVKGEHWKNQRRHGPVTVFRLSMDLRPYAYIVARK